MTKMKKVLILLVGVLFVAGCTKDDMLPIIEQQIKPELQIADKSGIKLQTSFVTSEVLMNVKLENSGTATIKITDISNRVVSKEQVNVSVGDNLLKVYTSALPPSAYRIALYDSNNNMLGITDFNKIN
mgnify:FL=1|jgi:hypothetical protein